MISHIKLKCRKALFLAMFFSPFVFLSCASSPMIQPQVNSLVVSRKFNHALKILEDNKLSYGENNELLFLLDYGMVLHQSGKFNESNQVFLEAKNKYDAHYTKSLSIQASTWLINDNKSYYRGEDYERVMINIFAALNYIALEDINEALVEARDVDEVLTRINSQYGPGEKSSYKEDAFARFLMGILYEKAGGEENLNDAFIAYKKALEIYETDFYPYYGVEPPEILKENLISLAEKFDKNEYKLLLNQYPQAKAISFDERKNNADIYVINYVGFSPTKYQWSIPIPLPDGYIVNVAFPRYHKREQEENIDILKAVGLNKKEFISQSQIVQDITGIAMKNLDERRARIIAKAVLRSSGKYMLERTLEGSVKEATNSNTDWFKYLSSIYNVTSEEADLRSWQTLPGEINIAGLVLSPGEYQIYFNKQSLGQIRLLAGEKKIFVVRTSK